MRYKISKYIQFTSKQIEGVNNAAKKVFVVDTNNDRSFLINPTIKTFIKKFNSPVSLAELLQQLSNELDVASKEIKKLVIPFFNYCKYRRFIVPENCTEKKIKSIALLKPGFIVDQFKIEKLISINSNVDVYKATNIINENAVVIKLLKNPSKDDVNELQREFSFLQSLQFANIAPPVYEFIVKENYAYFSQSFIQGLSLPQFIHRTKQAGVDAILMLVKNILKAFATIHKANIVHGDIHASNIMVIDNYNIKVIDFGLAINTGLDKNELVNFGGAYFFMPPERIKKTTHKKFTRQPDFYSDVFQLGIVLYILLYNVYPFNGLTWEALATEIKEKQIEFPAQSKYDFVIPAWLNKMIATCVAKKPKERFADAQQLYNAFLKIFKMPVKPDQQLKYNDCGISAIKSIFNFYKIDIDRDYIAGNVALDANGAWLQDIKTFFDQQNFRAEYNFLDINALKFNAEKIKEFLPCILPVKNSRGLHYVVIYDVEGKKFLVMDPAETTVVKWTFPEFMQRAYTNVAYYDKMESKQVLQQLIKNELSAYNLKPNGIMQQDEIVVANKLTYFSYLKENYGFASPENETKFLKDLLYNLQLNAVPNEFKSINADDEKLSIKTPVVLTVKKANTAFYKNNPAQKAETKQNAYRKLFQEMHQYKKIWYIYIFAALFAALITQLLVFSSQVLIDDILPGYDSSLIILFAVGLGVFKLFDLLLRVYKNFISIQLANIFDNHFLTSFIKKLNSFPIRYIHSFNRGDLTERMKDSLMLKTFFTRFFTTVLTDSIVSVYSLMILFIISWKVSLIILAIMVAFVVWFKIITPRIRENEKCRFMQKSGLFSGVLENIDGLQVIKSFNLETLFQQRIQPSVEGMMKVQKRVRYINLINSGVIDFIIIIASALILVFLSLSSISNQAVTVGQIITFIALSGRIFGSLVNIMDENLDLQENEIILKRYLDFDATLQTNIKDAATQQQENSIKDFSLKSIRFENIGFEYVPQKPVLKNFNFKINAGEKIRLEGSNGAGKSTFCKILSMLYAPDFGDVFINKEKAFFYNQSALRKKVLLISNDDVLFNDTLAFNINFNKHTDTRKILELSRQTGFHDFISKNTEGFDFLITEQGRNLSTGQRKKILLLRAFLSDAELIIIDEVLSGIDKESKEKIETFINESKRAFIIISHEPVENIRFDKTIRLQNGSVSELSNKVELETAVVQ